MTTALCWDDRFGTHDMGDAALYVAPGGLVESDVHIDNPLRIVRTRNLLRAAGLDSTLDLVAPRPATVPELQLVHTPTYVARIGSGVGDAGGGFTPMSEQSYELALLSTGSALTATDLVVLRHAKNAHAMVRRSGHHAWADSGYGFCIFNNCAVAARHAQETHGLGRVAILDIDAHHGNGTEAIFLDDPSVLTISVHQDRLFPIETGGVETVGIGTNINVNLPAGTGDGGYIYAIERIVAPALRAFAPELLVVACGVDASVYDPMAQLAVTAHGFGTIGRRLVELAGEVCSGRLVSVQEGGYSHQYAPFCWLAIIEALAAVAEPHSDPFEPFLAGAVSRDLAAHQREAIDWTATAIDVEVLSAATS